MNVTLPKKEKLNARDIIVYTISIIVCIIALIVIGLSYYFGSDELDRLITIGGSSLTQEDIDYQLLLSNFDNIFQNQLEESNVTAEIKKVDENKPTVYTYYTNNETEKGNYELNLNIPYINIDNDTIKSFNDEIKKTFEAKAENTLKSKNQNIIYSVEYQATVQNDILSLIIKATLKQNTDAQRLIMQTYNYDLKNNKEISLEEMLNYKNLNIQAVENRIKEDITTEQKKVNDLKSLGYSIFERNPDDDRYKVENTKTFFVKDGNIYIIYPYGNDSLTSEYDLVIV